MPKSHWFLASTHSPFNLIGPCNTHPNEKAAKPERCIRLDHWYMSYFFQISLIVWIWIWIKDHHTFFHSHGREGTNELSTIIPFTGTWPWASNVDVVQGIWVKIGKIITYVIMRGPHQRNSLMTKIWGRMVEQATIIVKIVGRATTFTPSPLLPLPLDPMLIKQNLSICASNIILLYRNTE